MFRISKAQIAHLISVPLVIGITEGSAWLAKHFPGAPKVPADFAQAVGAGIGIFAAGVALHYLKGLREWERLEGEGVIKVEEEGDEAPEAEPPTPPTREEATKAVAELPEPEAPPTTEGGAPGGGE
jgi:hypothetical protein